MELSQGCQVNESEIADTVWQLSGLPYGIRTYIVFPITVQDGILLHISSKL